MSLAESPPLAGLRTGVRYDEYVRLHNNPTHDRLRMAYLDGTLEIMSPDYVHELGGDDVAAVVVAYCEAFDLDYQVAGSTTFRKGTPGEPRGAGAEPDRSFYLGAGVAAAVAAKAKQGLDLAVDPPPSLWVEVENTTSVVPRLPLYARLGIPEVWRFRTGDHSLWFGRLAGNGYETIPVSAALPGLTPELVLETRARGRTLSTSAWVRWLKGTWFPQQRQQLLDAGAGR